MKSKINCLIFFLVLFCGYSRKCTIFEVCTNISHKPITNFKQKKWESLVKKSISRNIPTWRNVNHKWESLEAFSQSPSSPTPFCYIHSTYFCQAPSLSNCFPNPSPSLTLWPAEICLPTYMTGSLRTHHQLPIVL